MVRLSIRPREERFRELFVDGARNVVAAAEELKALVDTWDNREERVQRITELEHNGDSITHEIMSRLYRTFFTSLDREDIALLAHSLDDITDFIQAAADAMFIYKVNQPTQRAKELAAIILQSAVEVENAMLLLHQRTIDFKKSLKYCVEINRLENAADRIYRSALGELFEGTRDLAEVIKWREIYEHMETATDRCEDVANVVEGITIKNA